MKRVVVLLVAVCFTLVSFAQDAAEKINQGNEAMKAKDYAKALGLYEDAMANLGDVQVPESINYNIGLAAYNSKSYDKAIGYFDKAIAAEANVSKSYDYQARSYNKLKNYESAVAAYDKAIAASDGDTKSLVYNQGIAAYQGKVNEKAIECFGKSVENGYKGETAQYYKAAVYKRMKNTEAYKTTLEEGVAQFPGDKKMAPALAKIYFTEGYAFYKSGSAIITAANGKVESGSMTTADDAYKAEVAKGKKDFSAAIPLLEKAVALDAKNANAANVLDACKKSI